MSPHSTRSPYDLPATAPDVVDTIPASDLAALVSHLEQEYVIDTYSGQIHLIRLAPGPRLAQSSLKAARDTHIRYGNENKSQLDYFPWAFLVVHDRNWEDEGVWVVQVDFEGEKVVTRFRVGMENLGSVCRTLRDDDDGAEVLKGWFGLDEEREDEDE